MRSSAKRLALLAFAVVLTIGSGAPAAPPATPPPAPQDQPLSPASSDAPSPGARLGRGDESSEYWDVTAVFEQGHRIFARFSISNEGPGERTSYALGQIVFPDGRVVPFQNGRREANWHLSEDRLRVEVGSSVLDLHGPPHHFEVDKNKKGIKFFLDYESTGPFRSWSSAPSGYHLDLLTLGAAVRGTVWVRGVVEDPVPLTGRITVTHAWMDESEPGLVQRRVESHAVTSDDGRAHLYSVLANRPGSSEESTWWVARRGDDWRQAEGFGVSFVGRSEASRDGYPIPQALELAGNQVRGRIELGRRLLHHDPLEIAPAAFRWFLSLSAKPEHVWLESRYSLEWIGGPEPRTFEGAGVSSFYFMNPLE